MLYKAMVEKDEPLVRAIEALGSSQKLASELKIRPQAVSQWKRIPLSRVFDVEKATGIPHEELRPDFFIKRDPAA